MARILNMPSLSPSMEQGVIESWSKKVGDFIESGETLANIETDKAVVEYEVLDEGYVRHYFVEAGDTIPVGQPIAIFSETPDEDIQSLMNASSESAPAAPAPDLQPQENVQARASATPDEVAPPTPEVVPPPKVEKGGRLRISPVARRIADEHQIDLKQVRGSGPQGRIVKEDVLQALKRGSEATKPVQIAEVSSEPAAQRPSKAASSAPKKTAVAEHEQDGEYRHIPLTGMRKAIASRLVESVQTIPHFYLTVKVGVDALLKHRKELNQLTETKISVNDMIIKASGNALMQHLVINSRYTDEGILEFKNAHVGFAVATPEGLITPIVRNVNQKGLGQIAQETKDMAARAREKRLAIEEFTGGTFGTSNLGMFGIEQFTAIINPPQACNLAISQATDEIKLSDTGSVYKIKQMKLTLSCDHRVVDGASGAQFLKSLKLSLENPLTLML